MINMKHTLNLIFQMSKRSGVNKRTQTDEAVYSSWITIHPFINTSPTSLNNMNFINIDLNE